MKRKFVAGDEDHKQRKKKTKKIICPYGNYYRYYGYRAPDQNDPRVVALKKEWFIDRSVLDIGCNAGNVSSWIAAYYNPSSVLGIDLDGKLVGSARNNLKRIVNTKKFSTKKPERSTEAEDTNDMEPNPFCDKFPRNISFKTFNIVSDTFTDGKQFDVILCFSVSKWIHLNWGDAGLVIMFAKIFSLLSDGGKFIFEPQPWKSYQKKRGLTATTKEHYRNIKMRPDAFQQYLITEIGYSSVEAVDIPYDSDSNSFTKRLIEVYTK